MNGERSEENQHEIKYMYYLYYFAGGSLVSQDVPSRLRLVHIIYKVIVFSIFTLAVPVYEYYVINYENKSIDIIECFEIVTTVTIITTPIIFSLIVCYFHVEIETTLKYLANRYRRTNLENILQCDQFEMSKEEYSESASPEADISLVGMIRACESDSHSLIGIQQMRRLQILKFTGTLQTLLYVSGAIQQMIPFIYVVFFYDGVPRLLSYHVVPIPFYDRIPSRTFYYTVVSVEMIVAAIIIAFASVVVTNPSMIAASMNNIFYDYCSRIRRMSDNVIKYYEKSLLSLGSASLENNINVTTSGESAHMTELFDTVDKDLFSLIQEYTEFTQIVKTIQLFFNLMSTLIVLGLWIVDFENIFLILGTTAENLVKIRHGTLAITAAMSCAMICYNGKLFDDMNEAITYEVYNLPWYYMPPKTRKIINNFQSMVLKPSKFHVLLVYPITMALFPKTMNGIYSCFNLINAATNKHKSRDS